MTSTEKYGKEPVGNAVNQKNEWFGETATNQFCVLTVVKPADVR